MLSVLFPADWQNSLDSEDRGMFSRIAVLALLLVASMATNGKSDVMTYSSDPFVPNGGEAFTVPRFDPAMGTLNSVTIAGSFESVLTLTNTGSLPANVTFTGGADITVTGPGGSLSFMPRDTVTGVVAMSSMASFTAAGSGAFSDPLLDPYIGTGELSFTSSAIGQNTTVVTGSGSYTSGVTSLAVASVTYEFTPAVAPDSVITPEPASVAVWAGCGLALAGFAVFQRRRRST